ncbi:hypothetical protein DFH09DRAFT_1102516 [Mycena vulgaris]|nr:hypothetical protein DFH09DRAFT_1102516 [Mycena vulgaris]
MSLPSSLMVLAETNTPPQIANEDSSFFALLASFELYDAPPVLKGSIEPEVADAPPVLLNTELLVLIAGSSLLSSGRRSIMSKNGSAINYLEVIVRAFTLLEILGLRLLAGLHACQYNCVYRHKSGRLTPTRASYCLGNHPPPIGLRLDAAGTPGTSDVSGQIQIPVLKFLAPGRLAWSSPHILGGYDIYNSAQKFQRFQWGYITSNMSLGWPVWQRRTAELMLVQIPEPHQYLSFIPLFGLLTTFFRPMFFADFIPLLAGA